MPTSAPLLPPITQRRVLYQHSRASSGPVTNRQPFSNHLLICVTWHYKIVEREGAGVLSRVRVLGSLHFPLYFPAFPLPSPVLLTSDFSYLTVITFHFQIISQTYHVVSFPLPSPALPNFYVWPVDFSKSTAMARPALISFLIKFITWEDLATLRGPTTAIVARHRT